VVVVEEQVVRWTEICSVSQLAQVSTFLEAVERQVLAAMQPVYLLGRPFSTACLA